MHDLNCTLQIYERIQCCILYANLFKAKFYTVETFTLGHVAAHGAAGSVSLYAHA